MYAGNPKDDTESLTEFEEIERLIEAHTVNQSDDELPDLPVDLEQRILSGRVSRGKTQDLFFVRQQQNYLSTM